jgi:hypothetical protein
MATVGYNPAKATYIVAQMPVDPEKRKAIFDYNRQAQQRLAWLPSFKEEDVDFTCVAGNHFTVFSRMCNENVAFRGADNEPAFCANAAGNMDTNTLQGHCKQFATVVREGGMYTVLAKRIHVEREDGLAIIQAADNLTSNIRACESEVQLMRRGCRLSRDPAMLKAGTAAIAETLSHEFAHLPKDHASKTIIFALHMGGCPGLAGKSPFEYYCMFHERFVPNSRKVRGNTYEAICKLPVTLSRLKVAIALHAALCPDSKVNFEGWCDFISRGDLDAARKDKARWDNTTQYMEKMLVKAERLLQDRVFPPLSEKAGGGAPPEVAQTSGGSASASDKVTPWMRKRFWNDLDSTIEPKRLPVQTTMLLEARLMCSFVRVLLGKQADVYPYRQNAKHAWTEWLADWGRYLNTGDFEPPVEDTLSMTCGSSCAPSSKLPGFDWRLISFACHHEAWDSLGLDSLQYAILRVAAFHIHCQASAGCTCPCPMANVGAPVGPRLS